uniref:Paladin n=1 Tax=Ananas comosus var. bracteatus TaxID=296719 RepID=A0A6V7QFK4_ANACO|nr:unnamed protein product [Ananas comosus var. bracteatus]
MAGSLRVHGVAIPTIDGIRNVLNHIGRQKIGKQARILPFSNLEYTGINRARVEQMEFGNKILVTDELPDGQMVDQWELVLVDSVKTPLEVYEELQREGYLIDYERIPITDEKSPKERDFDNLYGEPIIDKFQALGLVIVKFCSKSRKVHRISQADIETEIVFNCQMGRGRTTTGMVIATLVYLNRIGASGIRRTNSIGKIFTICRGEYGVIRSLIRVLEGGVEGKRQVDKVIDKCDSMQNLREAIGTYRNSILRQADEMKREASLSFFVEYLERYYFLICFAVYIHTESSALHSVSSEQKSFSDWMRARPELTAYFAGYYGEIQWVLLDIQV